MTRAAMNTTESENPEERSDGPPTNIPAAAPSAAPTATRLEVPVCLFPLMVPVPSLVVFRVVFGKFTFHSIQCNSGSTSATSP